MEQIGRSGIKSEGWWAKLKADMIMGMADPTGTGFAPDLEEFIIGMLKFYSVNQMQGRGELSTGRPIKKEGLAALAETSLNYHAWTSAVRRRSGDVVLLGGGEDDLDFLKIPLTFKQRALSYPSICLWMGYENGQIADVPLNKASASANKLLKMQLLIRYIFFTMDILYDGSPLYRRLQNEVQILNEKKVLHAGSFARRQVLNSKIAPMASLRAASSALITKMVNQGRICLINLANPVVRAQLATEMAEVLCVSILCNTSAAPRPTALAYMDINDNLLPVRAVNGSITHYSCDYNGPMLKGVAGRHALPPPLIIYEMVTPLMEMFVTSFRPVLLGANSHLIEKGPLLVNSQGGRVDSAWIRRGWNKWLMPLIETRGMTPNNVRHSQCTDLNRIECPATRLIAQKDLAIRSQHSLDIANKHYDLSDTNRYEISSSNQSSCAPTITAEITEQDAMDLEELMGSLSESDDDMGKASSISALVSQDDQILQQPLRWTDIQLEARPAVASSPAPRTLPFPSGPHPYYDAQVATPGRGLCASVPPPPPPRTSRFPSWPHPYPDEPAAPPGRPFPAVPATPPCRALCTPVDPVDFFVVPTSARDDFTQHTNTGRQKYRAPTDCHGRPLPPSQMPCGSCSQTFQSAAGLRSHERFCGPKHDAFHAALRNHEPVCVTCLQICTTTGRLLQHYRNSLKCTPVRPASSTSPVLMLRDSEE